MLGQRDVPVPSARQMGLRVVGRGVCRADLHVVEGDLPAHRPDVVSAQEIVGVVDEVGPGTSLFQLGGRVGPRGLSRACGRCHFCLTRREDLCLDPTLTGWDVDGATPPSS